MYSLALLSALLFAPLSVLAHGEINRVTAGGVTNQAPNIYYSPDPKNSKTAVRAMYKASGPAFLLPKDFTDPNKMACEGAGPAPSTIKVAAGGTLSIFWEGATGELDPLNNGVSGYHNWVHAMGPVMDYITSCNGNCNQFDPTNAGWTKIAHAGIDMSSGISSQLRTLMTNKPEKYYPTSGNGKWAMAKLLEQGSKWDIKIPASLASGQYIVRHEIAAIHNPLNSDPTTGPQVYTACVQVEVTGGGSTRLPAGTKASELYSPSGDFAKFNVYTQDPASFKLPGPAVWDGVTGGSSNSGASDTSSGGDTKQPAASSDAPAKPSTVPAPSTKPAQPAKQSTTHVAPPAATTAANSSAQCKRRKRSLAGRVPSRHRRARRNSV